MSGGFCGINPAALDDLALQLEWAAADTDSQAGNAYERLTRHSRWAVADRAGTSLSGTARWARLSADDLRRRSAAIVATQGIHVFGPPLFSGPWQRLPGPVLPWPGPVVPGFPFGNPLDYLEDAGLPVDEIEDWLRGALGIWNGRNDDTFPLGRWVFGNLWVNRVRQYLNGANPVINGLRTPSIANGFILRNLRHTRYFRWVNNPIVQLVGKRTSFVFAGISTIGDAGVVWNHGNPLDALERDGAGYVADVARLGFSASTTAFLIAPNPVTGGIVIVTGVVWASAEVVDHWDEITAFWGNVSDDIAEDLTWLYDESADVVGAGWDWTTDRWDDTTDWVGNRWDDTTGWIDDRANDVQDWGSGQLDNLHRGWDWTNDRLDEVGDWGSDRIDDVQGLGEDFIDGAGDVADYAGERLDDAKDWTGDRVDDLVDVGGDLVDAPGNLWDAGKGFLGIGG